MFQFLVLHSIYQFGSHAVFSFAFHGIRLETSKFVYFCFAFSFEWTKKSRLPISYAALS